VTDLPPPPGTALLGFQMRFTISRNPSSSPVFIYRYSVFGVRAGKAPLAAMVVLGRSSFWCLTDWLDGSSRGDGALYGFGRMIGPDLPTKAVLVAAPVAFMIAAQGQWVFLVPGLSDSFFRDVLGRARGNMRPDRPGHAANQNLAKWKNGPSRCSPSRRFDRVDM